MSIAGREFNWRKPFGPLIVQSTISDELHKILLSVGNRIRSKKSKEDYDYRERLAGNLSEEYGYGYDRKIIKDGKTADLKIAFSKKQFHIVEEELRWLAASYTRICYEQKNTDSKKDIWKPEELKIAHPLWINYMKQGEWNPVHNHTGLISCVIYLQVPPEISEENDKRFGTESSKKTNTPSAGKIEFSFGSHTEFGKSGIMYTPQEKQIYIFPAKLNHHVYPFKSKVERISVSCNFEALLRKKRYV